MLRNVTLAILILGAINWGIVGLFRYDLITSIFGADLMMVSRIIFILVGIAGLYAISFFWDRRRSAVQS